VLASCEHENKPSASIKDGERNDQLSDYWLLKYISHGVRLNERVKYSTLRAMENPKMAVFWVAAPCSLVKV
jgi:hypothetical protein